MIRVGKITGWNTEELDVASRVVYLPACYSKRCDLGGAVDSFHRAKVAFCWWRFKVVKVVGKTKRATGVEAC